MTGSRLRCHPTHSFSQQLTRLRTLTHANNNLSTWLGLLKTPHSTRAGRSGCMLARCEVNRLETDRKSGAGGALRALMGSLIILKHTRLGRPAKCARASELVFKLILNLPDGRFQVDIVWRTSIPPRRFQPSTRLQIDSASAGPRSRPEIFEFAQRSNSMWMIQIRERSRGLSIALHAIASAITYLASVALAQLVASAHHLVVDPNVDPFSPMPTLTNLVLYHRNSHMLQHFRPQLGACISWASYNSKSMSARRIVGMQMGRDFPSDGVREGHDLYLAGKKAAGGG